MLQKIKKQLTKKQKAAERIASLKAKEDAIKRQRENAERKRLKKAQFAAKRRVERAKVAERQRLRDEEKARVKRETEGLDREDKASALFESRTKTAIVIIQGWRNRLGRNRQRALFKVLKYRIWLSRSFAHQLSAQLLKNAREGRTESVEHLLSRGADPNGSDGANFTSLMHATVGNHPKTLEALLEGGANVHSKDTDGNDALFYAIKHGCAEASTVLLAYGARIDLKTVKEISANSTCVHADQVCKLVEAWITQEVEDSDVFLRTRGSLSLTGLKRSQRKKRLTYQEETLEQKAERMKRERAPRKRPNAITALGLLTVAEQNAATCRAERARLENKRREARKLAVTTKGSISALGAMDENEKSLNEAMNWLHTRKHHRSITPALDLHPKPRQMTPLKTPPLTPSKIFKESGHVRPDYLKRLDPIDGRTPYKVEQLHCPTMHRSPSARRVHFVDSLYDFPIRDFNDLVVPGLFEKIGPKARRIDIDNAAV
jgi:hypothetical protein